MSRNMVLVNWMFVFVEITFKIGSVVAMDGGDEIKTPSSP